MRLPRLHRRTGGHEPRAGRGRAAVPAAALVAGLVLGGAVGWRAVGARQVAAVAPPGPPPRVVEGVEGPMERLAGTGTLLYVDRGAVQALAADGRARRTLGRVDALRPVDPDDPSTRVQVVAGSGEALAYGALPDGSPVEVRLRDGRVRRLTPPGWRLASQVRVSADGRTVAVCAVRAGPDGGDRPDEARPVPRTWILDRDGGELASLDGLLYDLARNGTSALLSDPGADRRLREGRGAFFPTPPEVTGGLRLWRRGGGVRSLLTVDRAAAALRVLRPAPGPAALGISGAAIGPDGRRALVLVDTRHGEDPERAGLIVTGTVLAQLQLGSGRLDVVPWPSPGPSLAVWSPLGGFVSVAPDYPFPLMTYSPPRGPPVPVDYPVGRIGTGSLVPALGDLHFSPDGAWLVAAGARWIFLRLDDPARGRVAYLAPGNLVAWIAGAPSGP